MEEKGMRFGGNYYALVIVDDYSRFTWTLFLVHKRDAFHAFKKLAKIIQKLKNPNLHEKKNIFKPIYKFKYTI